MSKYTITLSTHIPHATKIEVYELCKNGQSLLAVFFEEIEKDGNLLSNLASAIRIIEDTSNLKLRPKKQFRLIQQNKLHCKVYEAKSGSIRIYLFQEENTGRIIVTGGVKNNQDQDIKRVLKMIKRYYHEK